MLYQIQWWFKDNPDKPNQLVSERRMSKKISKTFDQWRIQTLKDNPAPPDAQAIIVNEKSEWFIRQ